MGIRIIISSSAEDKAKYKQRLIDWLVAMCLLFFMHYVMTFAVTVTQEIVKAVDSINQDYYILIGTSDGESETDGRKLEDYVYENGEDVFGDNDTANAFREAGYIQPVLDDSGEETGDYMFQWPGNLMTKARIELQLEPSSMPADDILLRQFGYTVIYLALVMYTILFLFRYLKRLMMLTFLTLIAPLMAMTYPLDKMKDGSAQGFNTWFREYLFNLLIQPVHLILYTVLIGSAMDLVADNLIYALVALGFILEGEKILRKFFGFDKATTVDSSSALGGALAIHGINTISKMLGRGGKGGKSGGNQNARQNGNKVPLGTRKPDKDKDTNDLLGNVFGDTSEEGASGSPIIAPNGQALVGADGTTPILSPTAGSHNRARGGQDTNSPTIPPEDTRGLGGLALDWARNTRAGQGVQSGIRTVGTFAGNIASTASGTASTLAQGARNLASKPISKIPQPIRNAAKNTGKNLLKHAKSVGAATKYIAPKAARLAAKAVVKGTLTGAGAVAGLTAGLVSDDLGNVPKWTVAGAGAGLLAGTGVTRIPEGVSGLGDGMIAAAEAEYAATHTNAEVEARQNAQADAMWRKDQDKIKLYQEKLKVSKKEAQKIMREDAQKYRNYGITDDKLIIKAMTADEQDFGTDRASDERLLLAKLATEVGDNKKQLEQVEKGLKKRGIPQPDIDKYINQIRDFNDWI